MVSSQTHGKMTRADRALVATYHEAKLADLIEHVRDGLARYDAGELSAFDLDEVIHHFKLAARELWKFCGATGSQTRMAAAALKEWGEESPDWWEIGQRKGPR